MAISIIEQCSALRVRGAKEVDQYERRLKSFGENDQKVFELLSEAHVALFFLKKGCQVTMRDRPDLMLQIEGETVYGEVKHMNQKETDRRDEEAMAQAGPEFVQVGNVIDDEGEHGYQGMCRSAIKKESQYLAGEQNILIFVSHSESLDLLLQSAVNEFDDAVLKAGEASPLKKVGGMMMFADSFDPSTGNIEFCPTRCALNPISCRLLLKYARSNRPGE